MSTLNIHKIDETAIRVSSSDSGAIMELSEHFTFFAEGYKFMPLYRNKMWDGKVRLYDTRTGRLPYGLLFEVLKFAKDRNYAAQCHSDITAVSLPSKGECLDYAQTLTLTSAGKEISPRDYQLDAYAHACSEGRSLVISPTGSGKSLIIYMCIRWYLQHHDDKVLIIVPTTSLVEQMTKDFADYSTHDDGFDADSEVHKIYSGMEKHDISARVIVSTWQSAITLQKGWFRQFGMVLGDEAHLFKAKSLNTIMNACVNAHVRIGTTGTLDGSLCNERVLVGAFGPTHRVITTKELMDNDTLASCKIRCLVCKHSDELRKIVSKMDYQSEIDAIVTHSGRNSFICKLALDQKGNTLILFNLVEKHGKPLFDMLQTMTGDSARKIFYVSGEVDAEAREEIRSLVETQHDAIIVASMGTFSTGINIKNLHQIVFAAPTKSQIRVLQSIGRGLRKSDDGRPTTIYDISDDFSWKKKKNYTLQHAVERTRIYAREGFDYKLYEVPLT